MIDLSEFADHVIVRRLGPRVNRIGPALDNLEFWMENGEARDALTYAVNIEHEAREVARVLAQMIAAGEDV